MIEIKVTNERLYDELVYVVKLFYTTEEIETLNITFNIQQENNDTILTIVTSSLNDNKIIRKDKIIDSEFPERYLKRSAKLALFQYLQEVFPNKTLPWGSLTGIRPTKLFYELIRENNGDEEKALNLLINEFKVTKTKANLVQEIINNQREIVKDEKLVDFYVNIPFCPSKCYYCSFISLPIDKCRNLLKPYLNALYKEIIEAKKMIYSKGYTIRSVYIGGGTPSILSAEELEELLNVIDIKVNEFTVECGRPDTITKEKLDILAKHNVSRISINPQSFNDETLKLIGRNHSSEDILNIYNLANNYSFDINMDLIAGLGNEDFEMFKYSLNKAINLNPENLTVHTLSIKRGSSLNEIGGDVGDSNEVLKMIEYSHKFLLDNGYKPYYLYKQKNMLGNLENIGYFRKNPCVFNIVSMEEFSSIIACGANAISKRFYIDKNRIERFANLKNIPEYISRIDEMIDKKNKLFS